MQGQHSQNEANPVNPPEPPPPPYHLHTKAIGLDGRRITGPFSRPAGGKQILPVGRNDNGSGLWAHMFWASRARLEAGSPLIRDLTLMEGSPEPGG